MQPLTRKAPITPSTVTPEAPGAAMSDEPTEDVFDIADEDTVDPDLV